MRRMTWVGLAGGLVVCPVLASAAPVLPAVSSGALALQLDAGTSVTTGAGNVVQTWADALGNTFTTGNGSPVLVAGAFNGRPVVRFGGGTSFDLMEATAGNIAALTGKPVPVFALTRNTGTPNALDGLLDSAPNQGAPRSGSSRSPAIPGPRSPPSRPGRSRRSGSRWAPTRRPPAARPPSATTRPTSIPGAAPA